MLRGGVTYRSPATATGKLKSYVRVEGGLEFSTPIPTNVGSVSTGTVYDFIRL